MPMFNSTTAHMPVGTIVPTRMNWFGDSKDGLSENSGESGESLHEASVCRN